MTSPLKSLIASGTKLWLDSIDPELVVSNRQLGASGATSNPIIIADLIKSLHLPALVIARSSLGTINHTLLTLRYAKASGIEVLGLIINHVTPQTGLAEETCLSSIQKFTSVPILSVFPYVEDSQKDNREYLVDLAERYVSINHLLRRLEGVGKLD